MSLLDKDVTEDIARGIRTVHEAAKGGIETAAARGATRLRSGAKTRKSAATREKIMAAATELMVERGNTDFQMSEVSARCQMSKGALYYYFADKGALVQAIFDASSTTSWTRSRAPWPRRARPWSPSRASPACSRAA